LFTWLSPFFCRRASSNNRIAAFISALNTPASSISFAITASSVSSVSSRTFKMSLSSVWILQVALPRRTFDHFSVIESSDVSQRHAAYPIRREI
jgi:hypothetical protein